MLELHNELMCLFVGMVVKLRLGPLHFIILKFLHIIIQNLIVNISKFDSQILMNIRQCMMFLRPYLKKLRWHINEPRSDKRDLLAI